MLLPSCQARLLYPEKNNEAYAERRAQLEELRDHYRDTAALF